MKRHALFVGVDEYADPTIQNLAFPTKDANDLAGAFEWSLKFDRVEKLLGPEHADDILDVIGDMTRGLGPGDLFFFFFAGHGFRVKDNHVLVCARDNWGDLEDEDAGLRVGRLKKKLRGPWNRMIVLDACQNDIRTTRGADCGVTARDLSLIHDGDAAARPGDGVQILVTSCSEGQKALEVADLRHGLFTSAFLETVKTFADGHMFLDPGILKDDLSSRMQNLAARYKLGGSQEPMFTIPGNTKIVLLDGVSAPPSSRHGAPVASALVVCPLCGKKNRPEGTFKCRECGRDNLCLRHQDEETFLCADCAAKARESETKAAEANAAEKEAKRFYQKGEDFSFGRKGVRRNCAEAAKWYRKAAELGHADAQYRLGEFYLNGDETLSDMVKWYRKVSGQKNAKAQGCLSMCYVDGNEFEKDDTEAVMWFRKAAEQGHALAQFFLGGCYFDGRGVTENNAKGLKWLRRAADQGLALAQTSLGSLYLEGDGVPKDEAEGLKWLRKAAEQEDALAQVTLGMWYQGYMDKDGTWVARDEKEGLKWLRKAAEQGYALAQYYCGVCYEDGMGVEQSNAKAIFWYRKAAAQDSEVAREDAQEGLERLSAE